MRGLRMVYLVLVSGFVFVPAASAQQASGIAGVARDTSGGVLPGVTVEASSPVLIERVRTAVTDGQGRYNIVDLRPGTYVVTFSLVGFSTVRREGIELTAGFTATVHADMQVGALEETVTVSSASPLVDTQNVRQQQVISDDLLKALPSATMTMADIGAITPGLTGTVNVGGVAGAYSMSSLLNVSFHGKRSAKTMLDGMRVNNMEVSGSSVGFIASPATLEEWTIETGGVSAESAAAGVAINYIPKQGGNTFSGSFSSLYTNEHLQTDNLTEELRARGLDSVPKALYVFNLDGAVGGPIKQDKLWFFTAARLTGSKATLAGLFYNKTQGTPFYTPDPDRQGYRDDWLRSGAGRLTWQISQKNKLSFFTDIQTDRVGRDEFAAPEAILLIHWGPPQGVAQATWSAPLTNRLLLEAGVGATIAHYSQPRRPEVSPTHISILEQSSGFRYNARGFSVAGYNSGTLKISDRFLQRFALSYVTGSHAVKVGLQLEEGTHDIPYEINNDVTYRFFSGVPNQISQYTTPFTQKERMKADLGLFAQDQWTFRRVTLNYGLRFDYYNAYVPAQSEPAVQFVGPRSFEPVYRVPEWTDLNPRLGASFDLFGTGRTAVKVSLGRYVAAEAVSLAQAVNPLVTSVNQVNRTWLDANRDYIPDCDLQNPVQNGECGAIDNLNFGGTRATTMFADDVLRGFGVRESLWDVAGEVQHELFPGVSLTAGYYRNWSGNFRVTDNLEVSPDDYSPYCIIAPFEPRLPGGGGYEVCGLYDVSPAKFGLVNSLVAQSSAYGQSKLVNDFINVSVSTRLRSGVQFGGGVDTGRSVADNCFMVDSPAQAATTINGEPICRTVTPFKGQTQVKLFGTYALPGAVTVSGVFQNSTGPAILANYSATNAEIRPSLGRNLAAGVNGTATVPLIVPQTEFEDRRTQLDLRLSKRWRVGRRVRVDTGVDIYNALNASSVMRVNTTYGSQWLRPIGDSYAPGAILMGRLFEFGGRLTF